MKKVFFIILITIISLSASAQHFENVLKGGANYLLHSFDGSSVSLIGLGATFERSVNDYWTVNAHLGYNFRVDDIVKEPRRYSDVLYIALSGRYYFQEPVSGPYGGFGIGLGLPTTDAISGDFFAEGGYHIVNDQLSIDFGFRAGYGAFRESIGQEYDAPIYETYWGFILMPYVTLGVAF